MYACSQIFGSAGLAYATAALTVTTLFFGELLPKALGVNNAEVVARRVLPIIIVLSVVLNPVAKTFTLISSVGKSFRMFRMFCVVPPIMHACMMHTPFVFLCFFWCFDFLSHPPWLAHESTVVRCSLAQA